MRAFRALCLAGLLIWTRSNSVSQTTPKPAASPTLGQKASKAYEYRNTKYGFTFTLPASWEGCKIVESTWDGGDNSSPHGHQLLERGPDIRIVNPQSIGSDEYQDIDVMIFTHKQWEDLKDGRYFVSAAPVDPGELGRNRKYVFAQPPRMINPNAPGADEIIGIMRSGPLHAF
jgi:hypothetical protein